MKDTQLCRSVEDLNPSKQYLFSLSLKDHDVIIIQFLIAFYVLSYPFVMVK